MSYQYPITNKFKARSVTEPDFNPDSKVFDETLYVNLDAVRGTEYLDQLKYNLFIDKETNKLSEIDDNDYVKIIFSGHRGCGKTTELKRLNKELSSPEKYFTVFIAIEEETEISRFQPEDFYLLLIMRLVDELNEAGVMPPNSELGTLANQLLSKTEVVTELKELYGIEVSAEGSVGVDIWGWLKLKAGFKNVFSSQNESSEIIRREIKQNTLDIIQKFNVALDEVRQVFAGRADLPRDILFIIDGSEKIKFDIYEKRFVTDGNLIRQINANMILSVSIDAYYAIEASPNQKFNAHFKVPMIDLHKEGSVEAFTTIITKRLDRDIFFNNEGLELVVKASGGCVRQLLILVNRALQISLGERIDESVAKESIKYLGEEMRQSLDGELLAVLNNRNFNSAEKLVRKLLASLFLLKYNGPDSITPNPLLKPFLNQH
jgi:GTPase SAR1 family protein